MNSMALYVFDRNTGFAELDRFLPDGAELEVDDAVITSGLFDEIPAVLFKRPATSVLVLRNDPNEFWTNLTAGDLQEDAKA